MKYKLTKKEKEYILYHIRIGLDSYLQNKKELFKNKINNSIQNMDSIPEKVWRKGVLDEGEYGIGVKLSFLENLYKKLKQKTGDKRK